MASRDFRFFLVGGIGRSGTSILAKTIASTKGTEFFYEPPVFMHILEGLNELDLSSYNWESFMNTLLYKDLMKGAISGRALNLNRHDISSVYNYKSDDEIRERFQSSFRQQDLENRIARNNGVIKVLDAIYNFNKLESIIPGVKAVIILRNPIDVARSIKKKGWFSDQNLNINSEEPLRLMKVIGDFRFPFFLSEKEYSWWENACELDRIAKYCSFHLHAFEKLTVNSNAIFVKYEDLISYPGKTVEDLLAQLNLEKGSKTDGILNSIFLKSARDEAFSSSYSGLALGRESLEKYNSLLSKL